MILKKENNETEKKGIPAAEKKYIPVCAVLCVLSVVIGAAVFFFEMYLSYFFTYNNTLTGKWKPTDVLVIGVAKSETEVWEESKIDFPYIGDVNYIIRYNYSAYNTDKSHGGNKEEKPYFGAVKVGDRVAGYFKPDDPDTIAFKIPFTPYIIAVIVLLVITMLLAAWARFISRAIVSSRPRQFTKNRTAKRKVYLSFMDISVAMMTGLFILCFILGMVIGASRVGSEYTEIDQSIVSELAPQN